MTFNKVDIQVLLKHYQKKGPNTSAAAHQICNVKAEEAVDSTASKWLRKFQFGDTGIEDKSRSVRQITTDDALYQAVEDYPVPELGTQPGTALHKAPLFGICTSSDSVEHRLNSSPMTIHLKKVVCEKFKELETIEVLPNPTYSPCTFRLSSFPFGGTLSSWVGIQLIGKS